MAFTTKSPAIQRASKYQVVLKVVRLTGAAFSGKRLTILFHPFEMRNTTQGLHQECVLAPLLFNIFFAAVINVAYTRFKADKGTMDALVHLRKKKGAGGRGEATAKESVLATPLWGGIYADDAGVVSQSPEEQ